MLIGHGRLLPSASPLHPSELDYRKDTCTGKQTVCNILPDTLLLPHWRCTTRVHVWFHDRVLEATTTRKPWPQARRKQESEIDEYHNQACRAEYETRYLQRIGGAAPKTSASALMHWPIAYIPAISRVKRTRTWVRQGNTCTTNCREKRMMISDACRHSRVKVPQQWSHGTNDDVFAAGHRRGNRVLDPEARSTKPCSLQQRRWSRNPVLAPRRQSKCFVLFLRQSYLRVNSWNKLQVAIRAGILSHHVAENKFERFRVFLEWITRFEFEFRRCGIFFEGFEFLVCSKFNHTQCGRACACAVACLRPHNSNSNVVVSLTIHDNLNIFIYIFIYIYIFIFVYM